MLVCVYFFVLCQEGRPKTCRLGTTSYKQSQIKYRTGISRRVDSIGIEDSDDRYDAESCVGDESYYTSFVIVIG